jgi:hypothetical protein
MGCRIQVISLLATLLVTVVALIIFPNPRELADIICFAAVFFFLTFVVVCLLIQRPHLHPMKHSIHHEMPIPPHPIAPRLPSHPERYQPTYPTRRSRY